MELRPGDAILGGRFTIAEQIEPEVPACGAPAVWVVDSASGRFVAKLWSAPIRDDVTVKAIWNHEVRSLLKLNGLPNAQEYFVGLEAIGTDRNMHCVVIDAGGRVSLASQLAIRDQQSWLRGIGQQDVRARLWRGLHRVAVALELLHDQGTLHRGLRPECVFTDAEGATDFRLSGFEWSLRLSAAALAESTGSSGVPRLRAPELTLDEPAY